ncbi:MAG: hypothetical protein GY801_38075 [bacterium]|nr:hypothetical protein [bacterium]
MMEKRTYTVKTLLSLMMILLSAGVFLSSCSSSDTEDFFPDVSVSVSALNFQVIVDEHELQTVTVKNLNSSDNVVIERVTSTNEFFLIGGYFADEELVPLDTPITIEGNGARTIYVAFYPTEAIIYDGKLVVESLDSADNPETDLVELNGVGLAEEEEDE